MALKKLRMDRERDGATLYGDWSCSLLAQLEGQELIYMELANAGMPVTSVREVRVLQACQHPNLVHLREVVTGSKLDRCARAPCTCKEGSACPVRT